MPYECRIRSDTVRGGLAYHSRMARPSTNPDIIRERILRLQSELRRMRAELRLVEAERRDRERLEAVHQNGKREAQA